MTYLVPVGRVFFALIFLMTILSHFSQGAIDYAASQGVPLASIAVPLSGLLAVMGGLSVALGYKAKLGAWLIVAFLVPVTVLMHRFWGLADPQAAMMQQVNFVKNLSILGGAPLIIHFGSGPFSLDDKSKAQPTPAEQPRVEERVH